MYCFLARATALFFFFGTVSSAVLAWHTGSGWSAPVAFGIMTWYFWSIGKYLLPRFGLK
jgi:hypothetical protein